MRTSHEAGHFSPPLDAGDARRRHLQFRNLGLAFGFVFLLSFVSGSRAIQTEPEVSLKSDVNRDSKVDALDLLILIRDWNKPLPTSSRHGENMNEGILVAPSQRNSLPQNRTIRSIPNDSPQRADGFGPPSKADPSPGVHGVAQLSRLLEARIYQRGASETIRRGFHQPRVGKGKGGYLDFVSFPPGEGLTVDGVPPDDPERVAYEFLSLWKEALVNLSPAIQFEPVRVISRGSHTIIRFQQKYEGLPIFGSQVTVGVSEAGRVKHLLSGLVSDTRVLDENEVTLMTTISQEIAQREAILLFSDNAKEPVTSRSSAQSPELMIFDPAVVGESGRIRLVWKTIIEKATKMIVSEIVLVDAHSGKIAFHYPISHEALDRDIYDKNGSSSYPDVGTLEREEGDPESGINAVDLGYLLFGDLHEFYDNEHGRDSFDDSGATIAASVRWGVENASWNGISEHIYMGTNLLFDDVAAHEFTHGVNDHESNLVYANESGAIDESLSDMWGEWFDQTYTYNNYGYDDDDSANSKWLLAEDYSSGAIRDMADPPQKSDPHRYKGQYWYTGSADSGGVHTNSGVGNKLCYLLTDGDSHNGYTISGMGISDAADIFYEVQLNIVQHDECYHKMYNALITGGNTLSLTESEMANLEKACQSVNIRKDTGKGVVLKDTSSATLAVLEDSGKPDLKKSLSESQSTITPGSYGIVIKDSAGTVVAFLDGDSGSTGGEMKIKGTLTENTDPPDSGDNILVTSFEGVNVTTIDKNGNLKIWGVLSENVTF